MSAGYTVSFPDGHILVLAYMEKIQRWLSESQGMPTTWDRRRARPSPNNERRVTLASQDTQQQCPGQEATTGAGWCRVGTYIELWKGFVDYVDDAHFSSPR